MNKVLAILSMLDQPPHRPSSATRLFHAQPVLSWTLRRLADAKHIDGAAVLCWDDQAPEVLHLAQRPAVTVAPQGPRRTLPHMQAVAAALRWSDGWRGGLLGTCVFDRGFHAPFVQAQQRQHSADAVLLVDPDSALLDPGLIDGLIEHARRHADVEYCFIPAAPGLGAMLLRPPLLERMAAVNAYPGRLFGYFPGVPVRDPLGGQECAPVPTPVARTVHRFTADSQRQLARLHAATAALNGKLLSISAEQLVSLYPPDPLDALPRDVVLELTTRRASRPIYSPIAHLGIDRPDLPLEAARRIIDELSALDDVRLTLGGTGDPLLHPHVLQIIAEASAAGCAIHVETDLLEVADGMDVERLAESGLDVLSIHVPALTGATYQHVMGIDGWRRVIDNIQRLLARLQASGMATPLLVPTFTKCRQNLAEMEPWYDQWLRSVGTAVIVGPSDWGGLIPDVAVADMSPPRRIACRRLSRRLSIHSDGTVVSCEEDVLARQRLGTVGERPLTDVWRQSMSCLRRDHAAGRWDEHAVCARCRQWHRP
jgi:radical SAM protein with 4Fe4S-binding SPASM domain